MCRLCGLVWCGGSGGKASHGHGVSGSSSNGWWWWGRWDGVVSDIILYNNYYYNKGGVDVVVLGCGYAQIIRALP